MNQFCNGTSKCTPAKREILNIGQTERFVCSIFLKKYGIVSGNLVSGGDEMNLIDCQRC